VKVKISLKGLSHVWERLIEMYLTEWDGVTKGSTVIC